MKLVKRISMLILILNFFSCKNSTGEITTVSITEYSPESFQEGVLVDVRTPEEFKDGHIPGAMNINVNDQSFKEQVKEIEKDEKVYLYCRSGKRSLKAAKILDSLGYKHLFNLDGGFMAWSGAGKEVEQ